MSYVFNRITVKPQLPERIKRLDDISYNLWWSWNTEFLRLFKIIDIDLWEICDLNNDIIGYISLRNINKIFKTSITR